MHWETGRVGWVGWGSALRGGEVSRRAVAVGGHGGRRAAQGVGASGRRGGGPRERGAGSGARCVCAARRRFAAAASTMLFAAAASTMLFAAAASTMLCNPTPSLSNPVTHTQPPLPLPPDTIKAKTAGPGGAGGPAAAPGVSACRRNRQNARPWQHCRRPRALQSDTSNRPRASSLPQQSWSSAPLPPAAAHLNTPHTPSPSTPQPLNPPTPHTPYTPPPHTTTPQARPGPDGHAPPNKILFVQNLPEATTDSMLGMLFQQFPGFKEVRGLSGGGLGWIGCMVGPGAFGLGRVHLGWVGCIWGGLWQPPHNAETQRSAHVNPSCKPPRNMAKPQTHTHTHTDTHTHTHTHAHLYTHTHTPFYTRTHNPTRCAWWRRAPASPSSSLTTRCSLGWQ